MELPSEYRQTLLNIAAKMQLQLPRCPPAFRIKDTKPITKPIEQILKYAQGIVINEEMQFQFNRLITKYGELDDYSFERLKAKCEPEVLAEIPDPIPIRMTILETYDSYMTIAPLDIEVVRKQYVSPSDCPLAIAQMNYVVQQASFPGDPNDIIDAKVKTYLFPEFLEGGRSCGNYRQLINSSGAVFWHDNRYYGYTPAASAADFSVMTDYIMWLQENAVSMRIPDQTYDNPLHYAKIVRTRLREAEALVHAFVLAYPRHMLMLPGDGLGIFSYICKKLKVRYVSSEPNAVGKIARGLTLIHNTHSGLPPPTRMGVVLASHLMLYLDVTQYPGPIIVFDERYDGLAQNDFNEVPCTDMRVWTKYLLHPYLPRLLTHVALRPKLKEELTRLMKSHECTRLWGADPAMAKVLQLSDFPVDNPHVGHERIPNIKYLEVGYESGQINIWTMQDHQAYCVVKGVPTIMVNPGDQLKIGDNIITLEEHNYIADSMRFLYIHGIPHGFLPRVTRVAIGNAYRFVAYFKKIPPAIFLGVYRFRVIELRVEEIVDMDGVLRVVASISNAIITETRVRSRIKAIVAREAEALEPPDT